MKVVYNAELDGHEIAHLKAIANVDCTNVFCYRCPLKVYVSGNSDVCLKDISYLCLSQNNIHTERSKHVQENN